MPDEETVQPIEEASTEEVIAPAGASDISNRFYAYVQLQMWQLVQSAQCHKQFATRNQYITEKLLIVSAILALGFESIISNVP